MKKNILFDIFSLIHFLFKQIQNNILILRKNYDLCGGKKRIEGLNKNLYINEAF